MSERKIYVDYLRIIATFFVVVIHVISNAWGKADLQNNFLDWQIINAYNSVVRPAVPIFVMISGALFLDNSREMPGQKIAKHILRLITAFVFWSGVYAIAINAIYLKQDVKSVVSGFLTGYTHLWFIFMIIGLYLVVPILREITKSFVAVKSFLVLALVFTFLFPCVAGIVKSDVLYYVQEKFNFFLTLGYTSYFVLGWYLSKTELKPYIRNIIYASGMVALVLSIVMTAIESKAGMASLAVYTSSFHPFVLLQSLAVFTFSKYILSKLTLNNKFQRFIITLSKYSFGIYLVHPFVISVFHSLTGVDVLTFNSAFSVPVLTAIVFTGSLLVSAVLNNIPLINKYIV